MLTCGHALEHTLAESALEEREKDYWLNLWKIRSFREVPIL